MTSAINLGFNFNAGGNGIGFNTPASEGSVTSTGSNNIAVTSNNTGGTAPTHNNVERSMLVY